MKFVLRAESPIHVGDGKVLGWLDYHLEGRAIHVLDVPRVLNAAVEKQPDAIERFAAWSDHAARALEEAAEVAQKAPSRERAEILRRVRDETSLARFLRDELRDGDLTKAVRDGEFDRYRGEFEGGRLDRRLEIKTCAKDVRGVPTIPASSLRGQIRSALLHAALSAGGADIAPRVMGGTFDAEGWTKSLKDATPGRARFYFGDALERALLRAPSRPDDPRFDLMRFVRVSEPTKSRSSLAVIRGSPYFIRADKLNPLAPVMCEAIAEGSEFEFELRIDVTLLKGAALADGGTHAFVHDEFWTQFARVFGVTRDEAKVLEPAAIEERMISAIEVALAARFAALSRRETKWFGWAGAPPDAPLRYFHDGLGKLETRVPLRIGMGSGLHGMTLLLALENDPELSTPLAHALARVGIGLDPRKRRDRAEREKIAIEKARREAGGKGNRSLALRPELLAEKRDLGQIPVSRSFTMDGPLPDLFLACLTLARGELAAEAAPATQSLAARTRAMRDPGARDDSKRLERATRRPQPGDRPERRDDRRDDRRGDRRDDRRDGGPPRRDDRGPQRPKGPPPKPLPDRPANDDEIAKLLERFGRR